MRVVCRPLLKKALSNKKLLKGEGYCFACAATLPPRVDTSQPQTEDVCLKRGKTEQYAKCEWLDEKGALKVFEEKYKKYCKRYSNSATYRNLLMGWPAWCGAKLDGQKKSPDDRSSTKSKQLAKDRRRLPKCHRMARVAAEILRHVPDVVTMQEVDCFDELMEDHKLGLFYKGKFHLKRGRKRNQLEKDQCFERTKKIEKDGFPKDDLNCQAWKDSGFADGVAILWNKEKYELVEFESGICRMHGTPKVYCCEDWEGNQLVEFGKIFLPPSHKDDKDNNWENKTVSGQRAMYVILRSKTGATKGQEFIAMTAHMKAGEKHDDKELKKHHARIMAKKIKELLSEPYNRNGDMRPLVYAADFNTNPGTETFKEFYNITKGVMTSAYDNLDMDKPAEGKPVYTNKTPDTSFKSRKGGNQFAKCQPIGQAIDFIFHSNQWKCTHTLSVIELLKLCADFGLPNWKYPSDHFMIMADLVLTNRLSEADTQLRNTTKLGLNLRSPPPRPTTRVTSSPPGFSEKQISEMTRQHAEMRMQEQRVNKARADQTRARVEAAIAGSSRQREGMWDGEFYQYDEDHNDFLDKGEFLRICESNPRWGFAGATAQRIYDQYATQQGLSPVEYNEFRSSTQEAFELFGIIDTDGSDSIDREELVLAFELRLPKLRKWFPDGADANMVFDAMVTNQDGGVSSTDFVSFLMARDNRMFALQKTVPLSPHLMPRPSLTRPGNEEPRQYPYAKYSIGDKVQITNVPSNLKGLGGCPSWAQLAPSNKGVIVGTSVEGPNRYVVYVYENNNQPLFGVNYVCAEDNPHFSRVEDYPVPQEDFRIYQNGFKTMCVDDYEKLKGEYHFNF